MHSVKEKEMLAVKLDALTKKMDDIEKEKLQLVYAIVSCFMCDVCVNKAHSGNYYPGHIKTSIS